MNENEKSNPKVLGEIAHRALVTNHQLFGGLEAALKTLEEDYFESFDQQADETDFVWIGIKRCQRYKILDHPLVPSCLSGVEVVEETGDSIGQFLGYDAPGMRQAFSVAEKYYSALLVDSTLE